MVVTFVTSLLHRRLTLRVPHMAFESASRTTSDKGHVKDVQRRLDFDLLRVADWHGRLKMKEGETLGRRSDEVLSLTDQAEVVTVCRA